MTRTMFKTLNVPATNVATRTVFSLCASRRTLGIMMRSGDGVSHKVSIHESFALPPLFEFCWPRPQGVSDEDPPVSRSTMHLSRSSMS